MIHIAFAASLLVGGLQGPPSAPLPDVLPHEDRYEVSLLTMDQGDDLWELFGHNAILIRDGSTGQDLVWNWGLFSLDDPHFLAGFIQGTMLYSIGPTSLGPFLDSYRSANRSVYANEIFLTDGEAEELDRLVRENFEPENRAYVYDYFLDNCSTRVRDVLDTVLGGEIRERFVAEPTSMSYRWHVRRLLQRATWIVRGGSVLIGMRGDEPRTEWEAMFAPMETMRLLEGFERDAGLGRAEPLLGERQVLVRADRPATLSVPPPFSFLWLAGGLGLGVLVMALGRAARAGGHFRRASLAATIALWGIFSGVLGSVMILAWFTAHEFAHWNVNVLLTSPLALPLSLIVIMASIRERWWLGAIGQLAERGALCIAGLSLLAGLLQLVSVVSQQNLEALSLAIPLNLAVAAALRFAMRDPGTEVYRRP